MWFALFSIIFYILSLLLIAPFLMNSSEGKLSQSKIPFFLTALTAIVLHAVSTFPLLEDLASGQSFTLMQIASLMSVIIAALATLSMFLVSTMWFVLPIVYAFSIISLIFATFLSSHIIQMLNQNTLMLFHIGLSLFTYAVCFIATLYGILDPELFVLSGSVALKIPGFIEEIEKRAKGKVYDALKGNVKIVPAALGEDCGLIGAACLAFSK